jgi:hypothetical protein
MDSLVVSGWSTSFLVMLSRENKDLLLRGLLLPQSLPSELSNHGEALV